MRSSRYLGFLLAVMLLLPVSGNAGTITTPDIVAQTTEATLSCMRWLPGPVGLEFVISLRVGAGRVRGNASARGNIPGRLALSLLKTNPLQKSMTSVLFGFLVTGQLALEILRTAPHTPKPWHVFWSSSSHLLSAF